MTMFTIFGENPALITPENPKGEYMMRTVRVMPAALSNINFSWMRYLEPNSTRFA